MIRITADDINGHITYLRELFEGQEYQRVIDSIKSTDLTGYSENQQTEISIMMAISCFNVADFENSIVYSRLVNGHIYRNGDLPEAYSLFLEMSKIGATSFLELGQPRKAYFFLRSMKRMGLVFDERIDSLLGNICSKISVSIRRILNPVLPLLLWFVLITQHVFSPFSTLQYQITLLILAALNVLHFFVKKDIYCWILRKV